MSILSKLDTAKLESCQADIKLIVAQFQQALQTHFRVVDANSRRLIESRWTNG